MSPQADRQVCFLNEEKQMTILAALVLVLTAVSTSPARFDGYGTGGWIADVDACYLAVYGVTEDEAAGIL